MIVNDITMKFLVVTPPSIYHTSFAIPALILFFCASSWSPTLNKYSYVASNIGMFTCVSKPTANIFTLA